jgi:hypothetical protein
MEYQSLNLRSIESIDLNETNGIIRAAKELNNTIENKITSPRGGVAQNDGGQVRVSKSKFSSQKNGLAHGFAVNTFKGIGGTENNSEDRVTIFFKMIELGSGGSKDEGRERAGGNDDSRLGKGKDCGSTPFSYFAVYEGFGGNGCANFMKENLHKLIIKNPNFPQNITKSVQESCVKCDYEFVLGALRRDPVDDSGCTAIIFLVLNQIGYMIHVGNSKL